MLGGLEVNQPFSHFTFELASSGTSHICKVFGELPSLVLNLMMVMANEKCGNEMLTHNQYQVNLPDWHLGMLQSSADSQESIFIQLR